MKFSELNLRPELNQSLAKMGYTDLTSVQEATYEHIIQGHDLIAMAETGSGKTSACGVPLVQMTDPKERAIQTLVLVPTRELAIQYVEEIDRLGADSGLSCFAVFGGFPMNIQEAKLAHGVHILVATPGRLIDCIYNSESLSLSKVKHLVLDEADEMLNMGFWDDVQFILDCIINEHQTLLFSATMPDEISRLIENFLHKPIRVELNKDQRAPQSLTHCFKSIHGRDRTEETLNYLKETKTGQVIVFCNSRGAAGDLHRELRNKVSSSELIHGGLQQNVRTSIFNRFKSGKVKVMIATDVAGRGLDFSKVTHIINYEMPRELENYTHRTGRTARQGREGTAVTWVTPRDFGKVKDLIKKNSIEAKWLGTKPNLDTPPKHTKSRHPDSSRGPQRSFRKDR